MPDLPEIEMPRIPNGLKTNVLSELEDLVDNLNADPAYDSKGMKFAIVTTYRYTAFPLTTAQKAEYDLLASDAERIAYFKTLFPTTE